VVKLLVDRGAKLDLRANNSRTALILACRKDHIAVASILVLAGADVRLRDGENQKTAFEQYGSIRNIPPENVKCKVGELTRLRAEHLWRRRRNFLMFAVGSGFLPLSATSLSASLLGLSLTDPLPPIDRSTPESNRRYLHSAIFGTQELVRGFVDFL
jgi:hypothetical protein